MNLTEKFIRRKKEVSGNVLTFRIDEVRLPNGRIGSREYLDHPGAVAVIPFIDKKNIVLVQQHRYPFHTDTWEIPAGKLSKGENPLECVRRELEEETGAPASVYTLIAQSGIQHSYEMPLSAPHSRKVFTIFYVRFDGTQEDLHTTEESSGFEWVSQEKFVGHLHPLRQSIGREIIAELQTPFGDAILK
jgi:ADP-ribose pyrophosphatase